MQVKYVVLQSKETDKAQASVCEQWAKDRFIGQDLQLSSNPHDLLSSIISKIADRNILVCHLKGKMPEIMAALYQTSLDIWFGLQKNNPYSFLSFSGGAAIKCNIKSVNDGFLFPLDKGLFFIQKFLFIKKSEVFTSLCANRRFILTDADDVDRFCGWISGELAQLAPGPCKSCDSEEY